MAPSQSPLRGAVSEVIDETKSPEFFLFQPIADFKKYFLYLNPSCEGEGTFNSSPQGLKASSPNQVRD